MKTTFVIRTEAGKEIGMGHLIRSIALAKELGASIDLGELADLPFSDRVIFHLKRGHSVKLSGVPLWNGEPPDVLIRDMWSHYPKERGKRLTVDIVDEVHERSHDADRTFSIYGKLPGWKPSLKVSSGFDWALIRPEFAQQQEVEREGVLVTLGGTDPSNSTGTLMAMLEGLEPRRADEARPMWEQLAEAKVVVTSAGMTMLEASVVGTPAIVMSHNLREHCRVREVQDSFDKTGALWFDYLGPYQVLERRLARMAVERLLEDDIAWDTRSAVGHAYVDGLGVSRTAVAIQAAAGSLSPHHW